MKTEKRKQKKNKKSSKIKKIKQNKKTLMKLRFHATVHVNHKVIFMVK